MTISTVGAESFSQRIATRDARVGIVGLGYAGLPLALAFAETGFDVVGIDIDEDRVTSRQRSRSYLVDVPDERYAAAGAGSVRRRTSPRSPSSTR